MEKTNLIIISIIKFAITLLVLVYAADLVIIPTLIHASHELKLVDMSTVWMFAFLILIFIAAIAMIMSWYKNSIDVDNMQTLGTPDETKTLLKVAYFDNINTMKQIVDGAIANNIFVLMTGLGKDIDDDIEQPFALFCDEKGEGTDFFMKMGATSCAHHCTGAIA